MKKFLFLAATLAALTSAHAGLVSFGSLSLSDNAGGLFSSTASGSAAGNTYTIDLPDFLQSDFDPNPGRIDFSLHASSAMTDIIGVRLTYFGLFSGAGAASYGQTIGALPESIGDFMTASFTEGLVSFAAVDATDISGFLQLADNGDFAQVTRITIDVFQSPGKTVPEPHSLALAGLALLALTSARRRHS